MKIVVTHEDLEDVTDELMEESQQLNVEINKLLSYVNRLDIAWTGNDKNVFVEKSQTYFTNMKEIVKSIEAFSNFAKEANREYRQKDEDWQASLNKANMELGKEEYNFEN
ncbi:MAG: WXG100 family type VII secretion target [Bacilli bacterium]|nr:WXG100 family type VII secretion target [Bacilli bacterium]